MTLSAAAAFAVAVGAFTSAAVESQPRPRVMPPASVTCPRDQLTAYTGTVTRLAREPQRTIVEIRTDWDTTEQVVVRHDGEPGPMRWFLMRNRPFQTTDWIEIEAAPGQARRDVRATAWVCEGGKNPIVDWNPAAEPPPPGR